MQFFPFSFVGGARSFWSYLKDIFPKTVSEHPVSGVLVIGETGTGKSTLINSLVGEEVVKVGVGMYSETATITKVSLDVEGVPVIFYDTPGLNFSGNLDDRYIQEMKDMLKSGDIHLVIYCLKMSETRMRGSLIYTFQQYNKIGVNWEHTVIALTIADHLPVPRKEMKNPGFEMGRFFNDHVAKLHADFTTPLV